MKHLKCSVHSCSWCVTEQLVEMVQYLRCCTQTGAIILHHTVLSTWCEPVRQARSSAPGRPFCFAAGYSYQLDSTPDRARGEQRTNGDGPEMGLGASTWVGLAGQRDEGMDNWLWWIRAILLPAKMFVSELIPKQSHKLTNGGASISQPNWN